MIKIGGGKVLGKFIPHEIAAGRTSTDGVHSFMVGVGKRGPRGALKQTKSVEVGFSKHHSGMIPTHEALSHKIGKKKTQIGTIHSFTTNRKGAAALGGAGVAAVGGPMWHHAHSGTEVKFRAQNKHPNVRGF